MKAILNNHNPEPSQLLRDIRRLERDVLRMGALVEKSFRLSHQALFARDLTASKELPHLDKKSIAFISKLSLIVR